MLFLKPIAKSVRSLPFLAMSSALVMVAGMLFGASIATADSVWVQSYERTSQTQACSAQPGETPWQASWGTDSSWTPSWEQWANSGSGGWTCTRSITWARSASSARSYAVGDVGPGGGLVFLISGGKTHEMAPKNWNSPSSPTEVDPSARWCSISSPALSGTFDTAVGTGKDNTALMLAVGACTSGAANSATAYRGGGFTDWALPSKDELNAMCYYSRYLMASPDPTVSCYGDSGTVQNGTFASDLYGFDESGNYWSSSQYNEDKAWTQFFANGYQLSSLKYEAWRVRPIRAF